MQSRPVPLALLVCCLLAWWAGSPSPAGAQAVPTMRDLAGRPVSLAEAPRRILCLGSGCLRLLVYLNAHSLAVGVENFEKRPQAGRTYSYAAPDLAGLPVVAAGGPANINKEPDIEAVLRTRPDLVFVTYLDREKADALQAKLRIPVTVLSYGRFGSFGAELYDSLRLMGALLGRRARAEALVDFVEGARRDVANRAGQGAARGPSVYVGGVGYRGAQGIESTESDYLPLAWVGGRNIARETGKDGHLFVDKEQILAWDPELLLLDALGLQIVAGDARKRPEFYRALGAVQRGRAHILWPFNAYMTNVDTVIVDAYAIGKLLSPARFQEIDLSRKAEEVYRFFLGASVLESMIRDLGPLGRSWQPER